MAQISDDLIGITPAMREDQDLLSSVKNFQIDTLTLQ